MKSALFVMDAQEDYVGEQRNKEKFDYDDDHLIRNINERISYYEECRMPVVYIVTSYPNNFFFNRFVKYGITGSKGVKIDKRIKIVSENYFEKQSRNAFDNKNLLKFVMENNIEQIELAGVDGRYCIAKTAESARKHKLKVNILNKCVATVYPDKIDKVSRRLIQNGVVYL